MSMHCTEFWKIENNILRNLKEATMIKAPIKVQRTIIRRIIRPTRRERASLAPEDVMRQQIQDAIKMVEKDNQAR